LKTVYLIRKFYFISQIPLKHHFQAWKSIFCLKWYIFHFKSRKYSLIINYISSVFLYIWLWQSSEWGDCKPQSLETKTNTWYNDSSINTRPLQGWQVSPHHGKNHDNYPVSADVAEILSAMGNWIRRKLPWKYSINRDFNSLKPIYIGSVRSTHLSKPFGYRLQMKLLSKLNRAIIIIWMPLLEQSATALICMTNMSGILYSARGNIK